MQGANKKHVQHVSAKCQLFSSFLSFCPGKFDRLNEKRLDLSTFERVARGVTRVIQGQAKFRFFEI